jgi:hypothetical protein
MWLFGHISRLFGREDLIVSSREERDHGNRANVIHGDAYGACPANVGGCVASAYVRENVYEARPGGRRAHDDGVHHARADGRGLWENGSAHVHDAQSCAATLRLPSIRDQQLRRDRLTKCYDRSNAANEWCGRKVCAGASGAEAA